MEERWNLPRYYSMVEYWKTSGPPVYMSVAGYLGLIKEKPRGSGNLDELSKMFAGTGGKI